MSLATFLLRNFCMAALGIQCVVEDPLGPTAQSESFWNCGKNAGLGKGQPRSNSHSHEAHLGDHGPIIISQLNLFHRTGVKRDGTTPTYVALRLLEVWDINLTTTAILHERRFSTSHLANAEEGAAQTTRKFMAKANFEDTTPEEEFALHSSAHGHFLHVRLGGAGDNAACSHFIRETAETQFFSLFVVFSLRKKNAVKPSQPNDHSHCS